jgi:hypothetical protein
MNYILFIILCIIIIFYILSLLNYDSYVDKTSKTKIDKKIKDKVIHDINDFKKKNNRSSIITVACIILIFIIFIIYYVTKFGFKKGLWHLFITWLFFTIATPTPQSGLMVSIPLKVLYDISMDKSQLIMSIFSLVVIFILHYKFPYLLNFGIFGKIMNEIIKNNAYIIIFTSIIGSTTISGLFDNIIDFINKKNIEFDKFIFNIILTIVSYIYYNKGMNEYNLYKILT